MVKRWEAGRGSWLTSLTLFTSDSWCHSLGHLFALYRPAPPAIKSIHVASTTRCAISWLRKRNMTCLVLELFAGQQRMHVTCDVATSVTDERSHSYLNKTAVHFDTSKPNLDYLEQPWRCRKSSSLQLWYLRGWSEKFSASTIDGNTISKIFCS